MQATLFYCFKLKIEPNVNYFLLIEVTKCWKWS